MELREHLGADASKSLKMVEPPPISEFLLFSRPIETVWGDEGFSQRSEAEADHSPPISAQTHSNPIQPSFFDHLFTEQTDTRSGNAGVKARNRLLEPYALYRESGVEWLGHVPAHWKVLPNRAVFVEVKESGHSNEKMLSVTISNGIIQQEELLEDASKKDQSRTDRSAHKRVQPGDIAYNKMRAWQGAIGASKHRGIVSPAYVVQRPLNLIDATYMQHLFRTPAFAKEAERCSYGITSGMWSLRPEDFKTIHVSVPPFCEQAAIVRFLDYADRRIRCYIRAKEKLIALLEEQKQAIIRRTVTGRINVRTGQPYPAYKPSGVEWVGDVPAHWQTKKLSQCGTSVGGMTPSMEIRRYWDGDVPWVTPKDMKTNVVGDSGIRVSEVALRETSLKLVDPPAVLVVVRGMILARKVPIAWTTGPVTVNRDMKALIPNPGINAEFLARVLASAQDAFASLIDVAGNGTRRLPTERWRALTLAIPSKSEQTLIVRSLSKATNKIDEGIACVRSEVELLREYRTRLVADVVTGKLDVRGAADTLPDVDLLAADDEAEDALDAGDAPTFDDDQEVAEVAG